MTAEYVGTGITSVPLGLESGSVANNQMTSSTYYSQHDFRPWKGRLNNGDYWATSGSFPSGSWLQVDFLSAVIMSGIKTQGSGPSWSQYNQFVEKLKVKTGMSTSSLKYIVDGLGAQKVSNRAFFSYMCQEARHSPMCPKQSNK